jgi:hypothetical protein
LDPGRSSIVVAAAASVVPGKYTVRSVLATSALGSIQLPVAKVFCSELFEKPLPEGIVSVPPWIYGEGTGAALRK